MGLIPDETFLALIRREEAARSQALDDLREELEAMEGTFNQRIAGVGAKLSALVNEAEVNASAIVGTIQRAQVEPGFALAEDLTLLEAKVTSLQATSLASIDEVQQTVSTLDYSLATATRTLRAQFTEADTAVTAALDTEVTTRASADAAEVTARTIADATLQSGINTTNANLTSEISARATADSAIVSSVTTLTATVSTKVQTFSQGTAPTAVSVGDIWIDTAHGNAMKRWSGSSWVDTNIADGAISASVSVEASARATSDGYLEGMYVVKVDGGGRVAGMMISAISNPATWTSTTEISFNADAFKIFNGSTDVAPFTVSGGVVYMNDVVVSGVLNIGSGRNNVFSNGSGLSVGGGAITINDYASDTVLTVGSLRMYAAPAAGILPSFIGSDSAELTITADGYITGKKLTLNNDMRIVGNIAQLSTDGWTPPLYSGDDSTSGNFIQFRWDGTHLVGRVDGGSPQVIF